MGLIISYSDIYAMLENVRRYKKALDLGLHTHKSNLKEFESGSVIRGDIKDGITHHITEVHDVCNRAIIQAISELEMKLTLYAWGWQSIEPAEDAILNVDKMEEYKNYAASTLPVEIFSVSEDLNNAVNLIADIFELGFRFDGFAYLGNSENTKDGIEDFQKKITDYENTWRSEFANVNSILENVNLLINSFKDINSYRKGDVFNSSYYKALELALNNSFLYVSSHQSEYNDIKERLDEVINSYYNHQGFYKFAKECGIGNAITHFFSEDPVDLSTGNFVYKKVDVVVEGDVTLEFTRYYNALICNRLGSIGMGFSHNFGIYLSTNEEKSLVEVIMEDGHKILFCINEDGTYENIFSDHERLQLVNDGYVVINSDNHRYIFNPFGEIIREEDSNKRGINYSYVDNRLEKVLTDDGEYISFNYNEEGLIESVSTSKGRTIKYEYKDNYLINVYMPNSNGYHYVYSSDGQIEEVLNADEIPMVKNTYDELGRVTKQEFVDGSSMTYRYSDNSVMLTERNGSVTTYIHDALNRTVKVVYPDKSTEEFQYNDKDLRTRSRDRNGFETRYGYTNTGKVAEVINPLGVVTSLKYDDSENLTAVLEDGVTKAKAEYDENDNLVKVIDGEGFVKSLKYDDKGHIVLITDEDGDKTTINYDDKGNAISIIRPSGATVSYEYDEYNRAIKTIDGNGNVTEFNYDINDRITKVINAEGNEATFDYNLYGKVVESNDFDNHIISVVYNDLNLEESITDKEGNVTRFEYDKMWNRTKTHLSSGAVIENVYDKNNRLSKVILPEGQTQSVSYDYNGNIISKTNGVGSVTKYKYDALNRMIGVVDNSGKETKYKYDRNDNLVKEIDVEGNETSFEYDNNNRMISMTNKLGEKTTYEYYPSGKRKKVKYSDSTYEEYEYDKGLLIGIRNRQGVKTLLEYDNNENVISEKNAAGETFKYSYDALDRLSSITLPTGAVRQFEYNCVGNMTCIIDENGNKTSYEYTPNGRLSRVIDANSNETVYSYDSVGNLTEVKRVGDCEEVTNYEHDLNGNITKVTDPLGNSEIFTYDGAGRVIKKIDRDENCVEYSYDKNGKIDLIKYSDASEVKMSYNSLGFLQEIINSSGITKLETDALGRVLSSEDYLGNKVGYEYALDKRASIKYPDGKRIDYNYNDMGLLDSMMLDGENLVSYTYDNMARVLSKTMNNGQVSNYTYNNVGRLSSIDYSLNGITESLKFKYDSVGNKISSTKNRGSDSGVYEYRYDALNQLIYVSKDNNVLREYTYDAFGNRLSKKSYVDDVVSEYSYNMNNQLIEEIISGKENSIKKFGYDKRGNLISVIENELLTNEYTYSIDNQLQGTTIINQSEKTNVNYLYNGFGQRVSQLVNTPHDPEQKINYVLDITKQYNNMLAESKEEIIANYYYDNGVVAIGQDDKTSYYMQDDLGSILGLTGRDCSIIESYDYDEFGNELEGVSNPIQSLGYTGYRKEFATKSLYAQARQYDPTYGRFTSEDILKGNRVLPISLNPYIYCYNRPEDFVDLDGREPSNPMWNSMVQGQTIKAKRAQSDIKMAGTDAGKIVYTTEAIILLALINPKGALSAFISAVFSGVENSISEGSIEYFANGYVGGALDGFISGPVGAGNNIAVRFLGNAAGGTLGDLLTQKLNHPEEDLKPDDYLNSSIKGLGQASFSLAGEGVFKGATGKSIDAYTSEMNFGQGLYIDFVLNKIKWIFNYSTKLIYDGTISKKIEQLFGDREDGKQCFLSDNV